MKCFVIGSEMTSSYQEKVPVWLWQRATIESIVD
jgi:hypothetical protein